MKDISMHLMDIIENSVAAKASEIRVDIFESVSGDYYRFRIRDNGTGMSSEFLSQVTDPWTTTRSTRKVGLGLALLQQNCQQAGGFLRIFSIPGKGTILEAGFSWSHLDRPPSGNIPGTLKLLLASYPGIHFIYHHYTDEGEYCFDTEIIKDYLNGAPVGEPEILRFLQEMITGNLELIRAS
jgi:hypothetical protein